MKRIKFRKWFSKQLFDKAKGDFERATKKVDEAKEMILLAKGLVADDKQDAEDKGEKINNVNDFIQLITNPKIGPGPINNLSPFGQFIVGFLVGDHLNKIEKQFVKSEAIAIVKCIKEKISDDNASAKALSDKFISVILQRAQTFTADVIKGQDAFSNSISLLRTPPDVGKIFKDDLEAVKMFVEGIRNTVVDLAKYVKDELADYQTCLKATPQGKQKEEKGKKWEKVLNVKLDFGKTYECNAAPETILLKLVEHIALVTSFKDLWSFILNAWIEKKPEKVNWHKTGRAIGGISSIIIEKICLFDLKKSVKQKWNKKYFSRK